MIPVTAQAEPSSFKTKIRDPGRAWLKTKGFLPNRKQAQHRVPTKFKFKSLWTKCLDDLHQRYGGICAFSGVYVELVTGARTVEHFKPKGLYPGLAYEWDNYRFVCSMLNGRKSDYEDVLDPFQLRPNTFLIEFTSGRIYPNPKLSSPDQAAAQATIDRLKLDDKQCRDLRLKYFDEFRNGNISEDYLKRHSPFVWTEAHRQKLL